MKKYLAGFSLVALAMAGCSKPAPEAKPEQATAGTEVKCELDRPVVFGELDWGSAQFHAEVGRFLTENAFGCKTDAIPGSSIPLLNGMTTGDVDVLMEIWTNNTIEAWEKGLSTGKLAKGGSNFKDAVQGWYVPKYIVEGENAPAKGLKTVQDLAKFKDVFKDPEEPSKGRFYNCISGWSCETVNTKKLSVYGLNDSFVNFKPGTGAALDSAVGSHLKRKKPIVFYYWGPSWIMGKYGQDLVLLEEPKFDQATWDEMQASEEPKVATAYPITEVIVGLNKEFKDSAPKLAEFLDKYETTSQEVSVALNYMEENDTDAKGAAINYLKTTDNWTKWVPEASVARVKKALESAVEEK